VATTKKGFGQVFGSKGRSRLALEVGTHSPCVSRYLANVAFPAARDARPSIEAFVRIWIKRREDMQRFRALRSFR